MILSKFKNIIRQHIPNKLIIRIRRWRKNRENLHRKKLRANNIARYGKFHGSELFSVLRDNGIFEGSALFVQCSFNDLHTFAGTPMELLTILRNLVGPSGTLLMPAFTSNCFSQPPRPFNVTREPTYTGVLSELFRRSSGVQRSFHPRHSICGIGPQAERLLSGHHLCDRADGPDSPFDRLRSCSSALILTLGLPPGYISFLHWIDDYEPEKLPFPIHSPVPIKCPVIDSNGNKFEVSDWQVMQDIAASLDYVAISKFLSPKAINFFQYKGVNIGIYTVTELSRELIALRDNGIIHYTKKA